MGGDNQGQTMIVRLHFILLAALVLNAENSRAAEPDGFSCFVGLKDFSTFARSQNTNGEMVLLSPEIKPAMDWNQLVVSWNAAAPAGTFLKIEARAISTNRETKFFTMGVWSPDNKKIPRASVRGQKDPDGDVSTDTLILKRPASAAQIRVTLGGTNQQSPALKFLGLSFCNTKSAPAAQPPNRAAWGKTIPTPERSQHGYPQEKGWCSPTSLSMALARWADVLHRPELNLDVPEVAAAVYDRQYDGTGNWPFNTAFAGSLTGMRSYVTRFSDISELEDWIAAGIPVIISAPWELLEPGRPKASGGHLVVCIGFTESGDVVINDPATNLKRESVQRIYKRENVMRAWAESHNTVYLVYPETAVLPENRRGHW
jgi:Peptidase_C39 like family